jgi:hypothetical protein
MLAAGCQDNLERASPGHIRQMENAWRANPVASYHIIVDVERPDDKRRNELFVHDGTIVQARVKYWNRERKDWEQPFALNQEQAAPFTVPGLFKTLREQLDLSNRELVQVQWRQDPVFPQLIVLGPVSQDGAPIPGTEATIIVVEFTPLISTEP